MSASAGKPLVEFYARKDCSLCAISSTDPACVMCCDARHTIVKVNGEVPFLFKEVDIGSSDDLSRRYMQDIPTVFINGKKAFKYKVDEAEFRKKVRKEIIRAGMMRLCSKKRDYST